jgi:tRNA threonylcarbamoyl adenosine modification protein YeaZ
VLLLALDTATPAVTVAVHDGSRVIAQATEIGARRHGEVLTPMLRDVLAVAGCRVDDVTDVAVGVGPGPYTSLRVGLVTALALALPGRLPVHGVCSLDVLAFEAVADGRWATQLAEGFLVATDARRKEVYWAAYGPDGVRTAGPSVDRPADVASAHPGRSVVGQGADLYLDLLGAPVGPMYPAAAALAALAVRALAAGAALLPPTPLYLRRPDATEPAPRKRVLT